MDDKKDPSASTLTPFPDARVKKLTEEAGSEAAISRGKWIAAGIIIIGGVGALGSALRPLLRQKFAANVVKTTRTPAARAADLSVEDSARLDELLTRLRHLQSVHRQRHPLWYGEPTKDLIDTAAVQIAQEKAAFPHVPPMPMR